MPRVWLWGAFVASTALVPGLVIAGFAKFQSWSARRRYWTAEGTVSAIWIAGWFFLPLLAGPGAPFAPFGISGFRWMAAAGSSGPPWRLLWLTAVIIAPHFAQKLAFPNLKFWSGPRTAKTRT